MAINGMNIILTIGGDKLVGEVNLDLTTSSDIIDVSSKATGRAREILPGEVAESISFESLADDTNVVDYGFSTIEAVIDAGQSVNFVVMQVDNAGVQVNGSKQYAGTGYFSSLNQEDPHNDRSTMSGTIEIDDELTITTYTAPE